MSNSIDRNYEIRTTAVPADYTNTVQQQMSRPQYNNMQSMDAFESSNKKNNKKTALIVILSVLTAAIGVIAFLAHKGGKILGKDAKFGEKIEQGWRDLWGNGKVKSGSNSESAPRSGSRASSRESKRALDEFKSKMENLKPDDNPAEHIGKILSNEDPDVRYKAIGWIIDKGKNYINKDSWELIFDKLIEGNFPEKSEQDVLMKLSATLSIMRNNKILNKDAIDIMIKKIETSTDINKLNLIADFVGNGSLREAVDLTLEQVEDIIKLLEGVKEKNFKYIECSGGMLGTSRNCSTSGLMMSYLKKTIENEAFDSPESLKKLKEILNNKNLEDNEKLFLINDIYYKKIINTAYGKTENGMNLCKELIDAFNSTKAENFHEPNCVVSIKHDRFSLGCDLFTHINTYDNCNMFSNEEKLGFVEKLKELSKNTELRTGILGNGRSFNTLRCEELRLKMRIFNDKYKAYIPQEDFEKYVDDMLAGYKDAMDNFVEGNITDDLQKEIFKVSFDSFRINAYGNMVFIKDMSESTKASIEDKIEEVAKKYFNASFKDSGSKNAYEFVQTKTEEAKQKIIEFCSKDEVLKEFCDGISNNSLDADALKKLKRKFAIKYHPDKVQVETQKADAERIFQDIYGAIEIFENSLKK